MNLNNIYYSKFLLCVEEVVVKTQACKCAGNFAQSWEKERVI